MTLVILLATRLRREGEFHHDWLWVGVAEVNVYEDGG